MPEISVVIPTYNRLDTLAHVIPTLLAQDLPRADYELLVCDSNSTDGTAAFMAGMAAQYPNVRHLPGAYSGRAAARNAGIRAAKGEVVLFNDSDILASPDLLTQHLRHHREHKSLRSGDTRPSVAVGRLSRLLRSGDTSSLSEHGTSPSSGRFLSEYFVAHRSRSHGFAPSSRLVSEQNSAPNPKMAILRQAARPSVAVVGWEVQVRDLRDYAYKRDRPEERGQLHPRSRRKLSWLYFLTGNASVRRDDLLRVGCFDESFTGYGHEDLELGYRLAKAGVEIVYEPRAVNYHCQDVPHQDQKAKMELAGRSTVRFYRKHPDFAVKLNLGMTPISLGLHSLLARMPHLLDYLDARADRSKFARDVVQQYHYVSGIKAALGEEAT